MRNTSSCIPYIFIVLFSSISSAVAADQGDIVRNSTLLGGVRAFLMGLVGYAIYVLLTIGIRGKTDRTAVEHGRWLGAAVAGLSMVAPSAWANNSFPLHIVSALILWAMWFLVAFLAGYIWKRLRADRSQGGSFNHYYSQAHREIVENKKDEALWAMGLAKNKGDSDRSTAFYINRRVEQMEKLAKAGSHRKPSENRFDWWKSLTWYHQLLVLSPLPILFFAIYAFVDPSIDVFERTFSRRLALGGESPSKLGSDSSINSGPAFVLGDGRIMQWYGNHSCHLVYEQTESDGFIWADRPLIGSQNREIIRGARLAAVMHYPRSMSRDEVDALTKKADALKMEQKCSAADENSGRATRPTRLCQVVWDEGVFRSGDRPNESFQEFAITHLDMNVRVYISMRKAAVYTFTKSDGQSLSEEGGAFLSNNFLRMLETCG